MNRRTGLPLSLELSASAAARPGSGDAAQVAGRPARLSACVGGFSFTVVEGIGGDGPSEVLVALVGLVEHSLVIREADDEGTERFRLLEPVRRNEGSRQGPTESVEARTRLAHAVPKLARGLVDDLRGADRAVAPRLIEAEVGNLRAAFEHLPADDAELLRLVWFYLAIRCGATEGGAWGERLGVESMSDISRIRWLVASAGMRHVTEPELARRTPKEKDR